jgi:hypothetical protein
MGGEDMQPILDIEKVQDFEITGDGKAPCWRNQEWVPLANVNPEGPQYPTKAKVLYSNTGIYFLVDCVDERLVSTMTQDFMDLYKEDVVEVFLWPDEAHTVYTEFEVSPLEFQLIMVVTNNREQGVFNGWFPWRFAGDRRPRIKTTVRGGKKASMAKVDGWTVEFFLPFKILEGLTNTPPKSGTVWRGNVCRIDYETGDKTHWSWAEETGIWFHDFWKFGTFKFK